MSKAWLYWKGIEYVSPANGFVGGNGTYDEAEIRFENQLIVGTLVATQGNTDCHGEGQNVPSSGAMYRADVTAFVQGRGNGSYTFAGLSDGLESNLTDSGAHSANGLSMLIYFQDGNSANNRRVDQYEGQLSNQEGAWDFVFPLDYIGGAVDLIVHVSDGQQDIPADGQTVFTTSPGKRFNSETTLSYLGRVFADNLGKYAGLSVPSMNRNGAARPPGLWDIRRVPLTMQFNRTVRYNTQIKQSFTADCVSLQLAQVVSAPIPEPLMLTPATHNFGDFVHLTQSPTQSFTLTNLWPYAIEIPSAPVLSSDIASSSGNWYRLLSQTCSAQTLAPGGSCSFEVACRPPLGTTASSLANADVTVNWRQNGMSPALTGEVYAVLRCGGVPNTAFSRLEFSPRSCLFTDTTVNTSSVPPPFLARNTGTLPLSINAAGIEQTPVNGPLSMISTTCTAGRVLAPNDSCEMRTRFNAPNVVGTSRGLAKVIYSAADQIEFQVLAMELAARSIAAPPSDGETLFKNGFELTAVQCLAD